MNQTICTANRISFITIPFTNDNNFYGIKVFKNIGYKAQG